MSAPQINDFAELLNAIARYDPAISGELFTLPDFGERCARIYAALREREEMRSALAGIGIEVSDEDAEPTWTFRSEPQGVQPVESLAAALEAVLLINYPDGARTR